MFRRGWLLILCLLASSLIATAAVHANESSGAAEMSCGGVSHTEDDTGQAPDEGGTDALHHHAACHGHNVTAGVAVATLSPVMTARSTPRASLAMRLQRRSIDPALRPPQA